MFSLSAVSGTKFARTKERLSYGENPESLSHLGLNWYPVVTDRQTDRRTDGHNYDSHNTRLALPFVALKNVSSLLEKNAVVGAATAFFPE